MSCRCLQTCHRVWQVQVPPRALRRGPGVGLAVEPGKQSCSFIGRESLVGQFCAGVRVYAHGGTEAVGFVGKKVWLMLA